MLGLSGSGVSPASVSIDLRGLEMHLPGVYLGNRLPPNCVQRLGERPFPAFGLSTSVVSLHNLHSRLPPTQLMLFACQLCCHPAQAPPRSATQPAAGRFTPVIGPRRKGCAALEQAAKARPVVAVFQQWWRITEMRILFMNGK
jgi:hypothetical protein